MSVGIFTCLLQYFPKNSAILVQKLWGEKKLSKSVFGYFKTKKRLPLERNYKLTCSLAWGRPWRRSRRRGRRPRVWRRGSSPGAPPRPAGHQAHNSSVQLDREYIYYIYNSCIPLSQYFNVLFLPPRLLHLSFSPIQSQC